MKRFLKLLYLPCLLLALWLTLNDSLSQENIILGLVLAVILSTLAPILRPVRASLAKPVIAIKLIFKVAYDIAISNYHVGLRIIRGRKANANPKFVDIPIQVTDPHGLAALSCIITFTPGTVWAGLDTDTNTLRLHVLDVQDEPGIIRHIQQFYDQPLLEIFQ